jgi:dTDP-4-dehydrorhamnose reductase
MRILLVGRTGQVGWELERSLSPLGELVAVDRTRLDLSDPQAIRNTIRSVRPAWIVNAAAYTNVDGAEDDGANAFAVNASAPEAMAQEARRLGAALIHYSTDYVFDGNKPDPYVETDAPAPLNVYGRSKLAGEEAIRASGAGHLILRTSWVYASRGKNFLRTILRLAGEREVLRVVDDQLGAPTWARFIAEATTAMLWRARFDASARERLDRGETVHLANGGSTSWCGFARKAIALHAQRTGTRLAAVEAIPASAYPTKAARPRNSRLDLHRLEREWGIAAPAWEDSLALCIDELAAR